MTSITYYFLPKKLLVYIRWILMKNCVKKELGKFQIYFRKIPLHQQKFLVVSVLSNSSWLPRISKSVQNETTKIF